MTHLAPKMIIACLTFGLTLPALATLPSEPKEDLHLFMVAAVDRNCDGSLEDESAEDRSFSTQKTLVPDQCIIYRTRYRNDGTFDIRHMRVTNIVPRHMVFIDGSTEYVETPQGLWPDIPVAPSENEDGSVIWRFGGALAPGEKGEIQFRVRLDPN